MLCVRMQGPKMKRGEGYVHTFIIGALQITFQSVQVLQMPLRLIPNLWKVQTYQKWTVLIPIGLSHNLLAQLWFPAGAAVLCHLLPCCWNRALVDRKACAWLCEVKNCALRNAGRAARRSVLGAGIVTLFLLSNPVQSSTFNRLVSIN